MTYNSGDPEIDRQIAELAALATDGAGDERLVHEIITSAVRLGREDVGRGDLKLINASLKELRHAHRVFQPYEGIRKLSIFGSARTDPDDPEYQTAHAIGKAIADKGWMVITGAGPGVMQAGIEGAGVDNSFGVGIQLPFEPVPPAVIADDPKLINFRYFFTRKVTFMSESHAFVALPGGFGTMDEAFELLTLLQTGKTMMTPLVLLESAGGTYWKGWLDFVQRELLANGMISDQDMRLIRITDSVDEAVEEVCRFYRNYHSTRFVSGKLVIRMQNPASDALVKELNRDFADIVASGQIAVTDEHRIERDEPGAAGLPRIGFDFDKHSFARLRMLIDRLNDEDPA